MKCNKCNSEIPLDAKFCPNCGSKVDEDVLKQPHTCVKCHTPMPAEALFCPNCGEPVQNEEVRPQIGDYYYTDGTYSHEKDPDKTVAGIVFSTETTEVEKSHGWTHGQIVATRFARYTVWRTEKYGLFNLKERSVRRETDRLRWGPNLLLPAPHKCFSQKETYQMLNDRDGYVYTYSGLTNDESYELFNAARNYPTPLPMGKTSGWYVPAVGQIIDILENIIGEKLIWEDRDNPSTLIKCVNSKDVYDKVETFINKLADYTYQRHIASSTQHCYNNDSNIYGCQRCSIDIVNQDGIPKEIWLYFSQSKESVMSFLLPVAAF